VAELLKQSA